MLLCFALALWNGKDPILKERLFGLTNSEGNHGEDVKEYYFYLDSTPTHSYAKMLYKYPQAAFPYAELVDENRRRSRNEFEYELLDTGVFDDDRYWDVFVEYAKARSRGHPHPHHGRQPRARGGDAARRCRTLWFRNTWWATPDAPRPALEAGAGDARRRSSRRPRPCWAPVISTARAPASCCSPTTRPTAAGCTASRTRPRTSKDGINDYVVKAGARR